jgi:Cytochrome c
MRLRQISVLAATGVLASLLCLGGYGQSREASSSRSTSSASKTSLVVRGKYIVEDLAVCSQCHTPRDDQGGLDHRKWLEGAALWLQSAQPNTDWPLLAPRIAGDLPGTDSEMIELLTTGIWRDGKELRPPMPQFRMSREDALAVIAYLKSLGP